MVDGGRKMSQRECPICDEPFKDKDKIVAVMLSVYRDIESDVHYAIEQPTLCIEIVHNDCYDWEDVEDPRGAVIE
jgi:hypothetical protein